MKSIVFAIFTAMTAHVLLAGQDAKAEKFADLHRKAMRAVTHIDAEWVEYCKGKGLVPDIVLGCVAEKPQPPTPVQTPVLQGPPKLETK